MDANSKTFVMYVAIQEQKKLLVHFKRQVQIEAQVGILLFNEVFTKILVKYSDYSNVFLVKNVVELPENIRINEYVIKLKESKQS